MFDIVDICLFIPNSLTNEGWKYPANIKLGSSDKYFYDGICWVSLGFKSIENQPSNQLFHADIQI